MQDLIENLDDVTAIRVLQAYSGARSRNAEYETQWSRELQQGLEEALELSDVPDAVSDGDLAREALLLLANDQANREPLTALIQSPPTEKYLDSETVAIGVAALVALQTYVKFERTKEGKIHFKLERKPLPAELIGKLISFFSHNEVK